MVSSLKTPTSGSRLYHSLRDEHRIRHASVLDSFRRVAREKFLSNSLMPSSGDNVALPIGHAQTTSSPVVIARMLEMMFSGKVPQTKVLEIGVGCGYQTALLAEMGCEVIGIERIRALAKTARQRLAQMGYSKVHIHHADGFAGYPDEAPYSGILVCAECMDIPSALPSQLLGGGRLILPLRQGNDVRLTVVNNQSTIVSRRGSVVFVSMKQGIE